jgi:aspartate beta-hydroxylase
VGTGAAGRRRINKLGQSGSLIVEADEATARGDVRQAASLLEAAAQRGGDASTLLRLATVRRALGDFPGAVAAAAAAVELSPHNFLMALLLGSLRESMGAVHGAQRAYRVALDHAPVDPSFQPAMIKQLQHAKLLVEAAENWRNRLLEWQPANSSIPLDQAEDRRMRAFRANVLENHDSGPLIAPAFVIPGIKAKKYFDSSAFAGVAEIERETGAVREEFLALTKRRGDQWSSRLAGLHEPESRAGRRGAWSMIPLIRNGRVVEEFASDCPQTKHLARALDLPDSPLISPSLYFSVLEPGSRIEPHIGITNARIIAHFPLIVPENCGFRVGGEVRAWEPGKALIFDDMTSHEAWNDSDRIRVVLIADLWRPELTAAERAAITDLMTCKDVAELP